MAAAAVFVEMVAGMGRARLEGHGEHSAYLMLDCQHCNQRTEHLAIRYPDALGRWWDWQRCSVCCFEVERVIVRQVK